MAVKRKRIKVSDELQNLIDLLVPSGMIAWFNLSSAPSGWVICDGNNGTPNLIGRYPVGASSGIGTQVAAGLPNITGTLIAQSAMDGTSTGYSGAFTPNLTTHQHINDYGSGLYSRNVTFNASRSNAIYGKSSTVTPPSVKLLPCMKL